MGVFDHNKRAKVVAASQHLLAHDASQIAYAHEALPDVTRVGAALNWMVALFYPRHQDAVANVAALPAVGNTLLDYRVVLDDGDGNAAGYRWDQWEGEATPSWHKIADMDWSGDSVLSQFLAKTQDVYVYRYGYDDIDKDGVVRTGDLAGQHIYGGASANTHLTLFANSGDGVGAATGYVQFADDARPLTDSARSLGTNTYRWLKGWFDELQAGTLVMAGGSITDSSGAISFGDEDLTTTGDLSAAVLTASGGDDVTITNGRITTASGQLSLEDDDLVTTGVITGGQLEIDNLTVNGNSITSDNGAVDFGDDDLETLGAVNASDLVATYLGLSDIEIDGVDISVTTLNENLWLSANGTGVIVLNSAAQGSALTLTGQIKSTASAWIDNLFLDGNTLSSVDADGAINLAPNGAGVVTSSALFRPTTNNGLDLGAAANRWRSLYLGTGISDGTNSIAVATLLSFRDALVGADVGMSLFYDGSKWVASAPDTEIDHGTVSGLGDDDHSQYALLAGRNGGQTLKGDTASGGNLTLEATNHATKGSVITIGTLRASADNTYDLGAASQQWKDFYIAGQAIGMRLQNATTAGRPSASAGTKGRLIYDTDLEDVFIDRGGTWKKLSVEKYTTQDAVGWDGAQTTVTYTVSSEISDARECLWSFYSNSDTFEEVTGIKITKTQTQVTVTAVVALPAGTYTLVGIG